MKYINKKLSIEKHYFQNIAQKYNTPTYCYSYSKLRENITREELESKLQLYFDNIKKKYMFFGQVDMIQHILYVNIY